MSLGKRSPRQSPNPERQTLEIRAVVDRKRWLLLCLLLIFVPGMSGCSDAEITTVNSQDEAIEILTVLYENGIDAYMNETGEEGAKQWKISAEGKLFES